MITAIQNINIRNWVRALAITVLVLPLAGYSDTVTQTVDSASSSTDWNAALWGDPASPPTNGNDYVTAPGLRSAAATRIGAPDATAFVRYYPGSTAFAGDSLTLVGSTEWLLKQTANEVAEANIIADGGSIRLSTASGSQATITGSVHVASESWIGIADLGSPVLTVASTLTGTDVLHVGFGLGAGKVIFSGDLSGFSGTLELGGGQTAGTLEFGPNANLPNTVLGIRTASSDLIILTNAMTFLACNSGPTNSLPVGTYTAQQANEALLLFTSNFVDNGGSIEVLTAPYPAPQPPANTNIVIQLVNAGSSDSWNGPTIWGGVTTEVSKAYFSSSSLYGSGQANKVNYSSILGRVRALNGDAPFAGESLTLVDNTELLVKAESGSSNVISNLIMEGSLLRYSPNASPTASLAGGITVVSNAYLAIEHHQTAVYTINSTLHGSGTVYLRGGGTSLSRTMSFGGDLSDFTGDFVLGEGESDLILDFNQNYDLPNLGLIINTPSTNVHDTVQLDQTVKVKIFSFDGVYLPTGTAYSAPDLDTYFGVTNFIDGGGTIEVYETVESGPTVDPVISSINVSGTDVTLAWTDEGVGTYTIQRKTNLTDIAWIDVLPGLPAGLGTTNVTASGADQEFYQIKGE